MIQRRDPTSTVDVQDTVVEEIAQRGLQQLFDRVTLKRLIMSG